MRVKTDVTLPSDRIKEIARQDRNRSAFLERSAQLNLTESERLHRDARELAIINRNAERLNREAADVLDYQAFPE